MASALAIMTAIELGNAPENRQAPQGSGRGKTPANAQPAEDDDTGDELPDDPDEGQTDGEEDPIDFGEDDNPDAEDEPGEQDEPLFPVKVGGQEKKVPLSELTSGYLRHADYTKRTMELADNRRAFEQEAETARETLAQRDRAASERLEKIEATLGLAQRLVPAEPDWYDMVQKGRPVAEVQAEQFRYQAITKRVQEAREEYAKAKEAAQSEAAKAADDLRASNLRRVPEVIPEWRDEKVMRADLGRIEKDWIERGGDPAVLARIHDPVVLGTMRDAARYRAAKQGQKTAEAKRKVVPMSVSEREQARRNSALRSGDARQIAAAFADELGKF